MTADSIVYTSFSLANMDEKLNDESQQQHLQKKKTPTKRVRPLTTDRKDSASSFESSPQKRPMRDQQSQNTKTPTKKVEPQTDSHDSDSSFEQSPRKRVRKSKNTDVPTGVIKPFAHKDTKIHEDLMHGLAHVLQHQLSLESKKRLKTAMDCHSIKNKGGVTVYQLGPGMPSTSNTITIKTKEGKYCASF